MATKSTIGNITMPAENTGGNVKKFADLRKNRFTPLIGISGQKRIYSGSATEITNKFDDAVPGATPNLLSMFEDNSNNLHPVETAPLHEVEISSPVALNYSGSLFVDAPEFSPKGYIESPSEQRIPTAISASKSTRQDFNQIIDPLRLTWNSSTPYRRINNNKPVTAQIDSTDEIQTEQAGNVKITNLFSISDESTMVPFNDILPGLDKNSIYTQRSRIELTGSIIPFADSPIQETYFVPSGSEVAAQLKNMSPIYPADTYQIFTQQKSLGTGNTYSNNDIGTDSIAFGGKRRGLKR